MVVLKKRVKRMAAAGVSMVLLVLVATVAIPFYVRGPTAAEPMVLNAPGGSWTGAGERREGRGCIYIFKIMDKTSHIGIPTFSRVLCLPS